MYATLQCFRKRNVFRCSFPGAKKPVDSYGGSAVAAADDDDDIDLFGSDEEADEEAEKLKAERIAAYTAKKSTSRWRANGGYARFYARFPCREKIRLIIIINRMFRVLIKKSLK